MSSEIVKAIDSNTLESVSKKNLIGFLEEANRVYHQEDGAQILTDHQFNVLVSFLAETYGYQIEDVGAEPVGGDKVELPVFLGSLDKFYPGKKPLKLSWSEVVVTNKIDGLSVLRYESNGKSEYVSRGNGVIGTRWTTAGKYFQGLPKTIPKGVKIRGELTISRHVFQTEFGDFKTSRNAVCGILNRDKLNPDHIRKLTFVAYEVVEPRMNISEQMTYLQKNGYIIPDPLSLPNSQGNESTLVDTLKMLYISRRVESDYDIDGLVVTSDDQVFEANTSGNPDYSFAFKMQEVLDRGTTTILDIEWNVSKDGYLKPVGILDPIVLGQVKVGRVTLKNAAYVQKMGLGVGARVTLIRSGDVIPEIVDVVSPAAPTFPSSKWHWTDSKVDIVIDAPNDDMLISQLTKFAETIECDGLRKGTVKKLVVAGFKTIPDIIEGKLDDISGIGSKNATTIQHNLRQALSSASLSTLIASTPGALRGFKIKTVDTILSVVPNILTHSDLEAVKRILLATPNFGEKRVKAFLNAISSINGFLVSVAPYRSKPSITNTTKGKIKPSVDQVFAGKHFLFSGVRDKSLEKFLKDRGGTVLSSFSKKHLATTQLIIKSGGEKKSSKIKFAEDNKILIEDIESFRQLVKT